MCIDICVCIGLSLYMYYEDISTYSPTDNWVSPSIESPCETFEVVSELTLRISPKFSFILHKHNLLTVTFFVNQSMHQISDCQSNGTKGFGDTRCLPSLESLLCPGADGVCAFAVVCLLLSEGGSLTLLPLTAVSFLFLDT